jgi:hypothetical protein
VKNSERRSMDSGATAARMAPPQDGKQMTFPSTEEEPGVATSPSPLGDVVVDSAQFGGGFIDPPRSSDSELAVLGDDDDEIAAADDDDSDDDDDIDTDTDDSDIEFEEDDDDPLDQLGDDKTAGGDDDLILAPVEFLGKPARFATVDSTAGFMLLRAGDAAQDGGDITVHYRYVRFTKEESGGPGVRVFSGAKLHPFRFLVPNLADPASSLRLAGAALAEMVYPRRFSAQLQALWSNLVAAAPVGVLPPRVEATVCVGILLRRDLTPERMTSVRAELAALAREEAEVWPFLRYVGVVTRLPAPVTRPAKGRRLEEEKCAICHEVLERGLAAWPQCEHVFHGECCERLLVSGHRRCPLCRMELNVPPVQR